MFTLNPVAYITVDFKKLVSDLFNAGFALVGTSLSREKQAYQNSPETQQ